MPRLSRRFAAVGVAVILATGSVTLSGCSLVREAVDGASGGKVDVGGASVPSSYPSKDVPLATGTVVYGAAVQAGGQKNWTVTVKVSGASAADAISTQLTGAGFTKSADVGQDSVGSTESFTKGDYSVVVLVTNAGGSTGWTATYAVVLASGTAASPSPSATP